jgi:inner membrane transporter RhtA
LKIGNSPLVPVALLIIAIISVQVGAGVSKGLFASVGAEGATVFRFGFSAIILGAIFQPWKMKIDKSNWKILLLYGFSMCGACLFFYMSLKTLPLGIASAIEFSGPIAVAVYSSRRLLDFTWIGLAVVGLFLLMPATSLQAPLDVTGVVYALIAAVSWGIYILSGQKAGTENGPRTTALGVFIAALIVLPVGLIHAGTALFDLSLLPLGIATAILTSAVPFTLEMISMQRLSALAFGTLLSLEPAIASLVGYGFLHEKLTPTQCLAIGLIVAASAGITLTTRKKSS